MSAREIVECVPTAKTKAAVRRGWRDYHRSVFEYGPSDEWDRRVIDQAIRAIARQGERFSVNDFRDLLPEVRKCLISRRLIAAQNDGWLEFAGVTPSTLESTKSAFVHVYKPIPEQIPRVLRTAS